MFCSRCGVAASEGAKFCGGCGAALDAAATAMAIPVPPPLPPAAPFVQAPPLIFEGQSRRDYVPAKRPGNPAAAAAWILLVFACAGALVPGLGFGMWLIVAPILLITLVLGVVAISRGSAINGVMIILMSLIVVPVFVAVAPFVGAGLALGAVGAADTTTTKPAANDAIPFADLDATTPANAFDDAVTTPPTDVPINEDADASSQTTTAPEDPSTHTEPAVQPRWETTESATPIAAEPVAAPERPATFVAAGVRYAVLRTRPSTFSKGLGRLEPGTPVQAGAHLLDSDWVSVTTADGRQGYLKTSEVETRAR